MGSQPEISIIIPVKNGAPWIEKCLQSLVQQTLFYQTEIIVIDSGSEDGTLEIAKRYPVQTHSIPSHEFNHGNTRNLGVALANGKYIVMTVQDAQAVDNKWLEKLKKGFDAAPEVAAVCGQQIVPHDPDKNPLDWFRPSGSSSLVVHHFAGGSYEILTPEERKNCCGWDNVTAMYRRDVVEALIFPETVCSEDIIWADTALKAGKTLVYNTAANVYHYHHEDWNYVFSRTFSVMYTRYRQFGFLHPKPSQNLRFKVSLLKTIGLATRFSPRGVWYWWRYNRQRFEATKKAHELFLDALAEGEESLTAAFEKYCGKVHTPIRQVQLKETAKQNSVDRN